MTNDRRSAPPRSEHGFAFNSLPSLRAHSVLAACFAASLVGCKEDPTRPSEKSPALHATVLLLASGAPVRVRDVPAVSVDLPLLPRVIDNDDSVLVRGLSQG